MWKDFVLALRGIAHRPSFSILAVLSLGLGIAANASLFSIAREALFRPLPYPDSKQLVTILGRWKSNETVLSDAEVLYLRQRATVLEEIAVRAPWKTGLVGQGPRRPVFALRVSANYFGTLGVQPHLGRGFAAESADERTAVISERLWQSDFGGDPRILGRSIQLGNESYTVVGVMQARGLDHQAALWIKTRLDANAANRGRWPALGRLGAGISLDQARREINQLHVHFLKENPPNYRGALVVEELRSALLDGSEWFGGEPVRLRLYAAMGLLGFLLLMGCANVANLLMIRARSRQREIAIRKALGAGRGRIARQLLIEGLAFASIAGAAGLVLAVAARGVVLSLGQAIASLGEQVATSSVLACGVFLTLLCSLAGSLLPAWTASRISASSSRLSGEEAMTNRHTVRSGNRFSRAFIFLQVALSTALLISGSIMLRSLAALDNVEFGFAPDNILKVDLQLPPGKYSERAAGSGERGYSFYTIREQMDQFFRASAAGLARLPGVQGVAAADRFDSDQCRFWFALPGQASLNLAQEMAAGKLDEQSACVRPVGQGYFAALRIPLKSGRAFLPEEDVPVAVINESMARQLWPGRDPIGRRIEVIFDTLRAEEAARSSREVVGVVGDARFNRLAKSPARMAYIPYSQYPSGPQMRSVSRFQQTFLLRHPPGSSPTLKQVAGVIGRLDSDVTLTRVAALRSELDDPSALTRTYTRLLALLAGLGLLLAVTGIYGVTAFAVRIRSSEISIRKAVGASLPDVLRLIAGQYTATILAGLGVGVGAAFVSTETLSSLLYGVEADSYLTFIASCALVLALALTASLLPAHRAYRVHSADLLRSQ